ncbi:MAG: hypothetical protein NZL88_05140, partial [Gaiellaceae bacterium]|nr:hypothetical protein [Gaiellaceae bacterium]
MSRALVVVPLGLLLLLAPSIAPATSEIRLKGIVASTDSETHLVVVRASRTLVSLHVPGSLAAIRIGQRVELRGTTLRAKGKGSRLLARGVTIVSSRPLEPTPPPVTPGARADDRDEDDEREITGTLTSLSPVTVVAGARSVSCVVPAGMSLAGLAVGDLVEMTCDLVRGQWVVRKIEREDDDDRREDRDDDDDD